jgi:bifunctional DNA-binding transcriptional regulator/antitoxin component of YhaV-PrlF toxin-antitoxin module
MADIMRLNNGALTLPEAWLKRLNIDANDKVSVEIQEHKLVIKPIHEQQEVQDNPENKLPPNIQELLREKGWTWPPDGKLKAEIREASEKFVGGIKMDKEVIKELNKEYPWFETTNAL